MLSQGESNQMSLSTSPLLYQFTYSCRDTYTDWQDRPKILTMDIRIYSQVASQIDAV